MSTTRDTRFGSMAAHFARHPRGVTVARITAGAESPTPGEKPGDALRRLFATHDTGIAPGEATLTYVMTTQPPREP